MFHLSQVRLGLHSVQKLKVDLRKRKVTHFAVGNQTMFSEETREWHEWVEPAHI
jgi:hypothetical protein